MSRRKERTEGEATLQVICDGSRARTHAPYRIAACTTWTAPFTPGVVRVRYVHPRDESRAKDDQTRWSGKIDDGMHITWWLECGRCPQKRPISADHLADLVRRLDLLNVSRVSLSDIAQ